MQYRKVQKTGWQWSVVGVGCWGIGGQYGAVSSATAVAALRRAVDLGINLFDTADAYGVEMGLSEELVGQALQGVRDKVYIATKVGNWGRRFGHPLPYTHPTHIYGCCDASLHRLRTDYIDLYQCHIGDLADPTVFLEAFARLQQQGKIRAFGLSTHSVAALERLNRTGQCVACQLDYSLLNRAPEADLLPYCQQSGIATMIRGPLHQGLLGGQYTATSQFNDEVRRKWNDGPGRQEYRAKIATVEKLRSATGGQPLATAALGWLLANPAVTTVIPGAKSSEQVEQHAAAAASALSDQQLKAMELATASTGL